MAVLDLRGVPCPLNFVRTKLALEQMHVGKQLEVWLDAGEPVQQVPPSLEMCGHRIVRLEQQAAGYFILLAERGVPRSTSDAAS